jgi:hypothetical protein
MHVLDKGGGGFVLACARRLLELDKTTLMPLLER